MPETACSSAPAVHGVPPSVMPPALAGFVTVTRTATREVLSCGRWSRLGWASRDQQHTWAALSAAEAGLTDGKALLEYVVDGRECTHKEVHHHQR